MSNWIDSALATASRSLIVSGKRAEVLATNIANANTPGYKARDIDFRSILKEESMASESLARTSAGHIGTGIGNSFHSYERPVSGEVKAGNTVSKEKEQAAYTENSIRYLASLRFLNGNVQGIMKALRGE